MVSCGSEACTLEKVDSTSDIKTKLQGLLTSVVAENKLSALQGQTFTIVIDVVDEPTVDYTLNIQ